MTRPSPLRRGWRATLVAGAATALVAASLSTASPALAAPEDEPDPRIGLSAGLFDAGTAASGIDLLSTTPKAGAFDTATAYNSDLAFTGDYAIAGNYQGFQVYDVADAAEPTLRSSFVCPGGQGDVSVYGDLLFMSVEENRGRIDCGTATPLPSERFRGVRIFDISDIDNPIQLPGIQTCRGSHTHTVVTDPDDAENVYVYVSGTAGVRSGTEVEGCINSPADSENPSRWRIEVIQVPLAAPETASIVNQPRLFADDSGAVNGLWPGGDHGEGTQRTSETDACHDITAYPEIGLAAGACEGNGILIDISDPANPVRIDAVTDPGFAYWHSATFSNDGSKVVFTDEWGGGSGARCRDIDRPDWGANAIYDVVDGKLQFASYYKLPVVQTAQENCVAHNGSLVPVPGRDIMVQAWYQGGVSVFDFTDSANPYEIAFFDRGPVDASRLVLGGYWSTYWNNGAIVGTEIQRGFDTMALTPSAHLSENEIAAASLIRVAEANVQGQVSYTHEPSFPVAGSFVDQAERAGTVSADAAATARAQLERAAGIEGDPIAVGTALELAARAVSADPAAEAAIRALLAEIGAPDTGAPTVTVKPESIGRDGVYSSVSFKLYDEYLVDRVTLNGVEKVLSPNAWSDLNGVTPGVFGAQAGQNELVVYDVAGNATTVAFVLDVTAPTVTVKPEGTSGTAEDGYASVSFKLFDEYKVDRLTLNGVEKNLSDNVWSDLNGVAPGVFGATEGANELRVFDVAGNVATVPFTLVTDAAPTAPAWSAGTTYDRGDEVTFGGATWVAEWWTRGQEPGNPTGPWKERGAAVPAADADAWTASWIYTGGETVAHDDRLWQAKWWTRNQEPGDPNGPWADLGAY